MSISLFTLSSSKLISYFSTTFQIVLYCYVVCKRRKSLFSGYKKWIGFKYFWSVTFEHWPRTVMGKLFCERDKKQKH
jgi:hypothetical protein